MRKLSALPGALYFARARFDLPGDAVPVERVAGPYSQPGRARHALEKLLAEWPQLTPSAAHVVTSGAIDWAAVDTTDEVAE